MKSLQILKPTLCLIIYSSCITLIVQLLPFVSSDTVSYGSKINEAFCTTGTDSGDNFSSCNDDENIDNPSGLVPMLKDSIETMWSSLDKDDNGYLAEDEIANFIKENSNPTIDEKEANSTAKAYLKYFDDNLDTVVCKYELHYAVHDVSNSEEIEFFKGIGDGFLYFIKKLIGENPKKIPVYSMKLFQLFDEDINGKLTWKEVRMVIRMAEIFVGIPEDKRMDESSRESLLPIIKRDNKNKWLNLDEFFKLLKVLEVSPDIMFYHYVCDYLEGDSDYSSASDLTKKEFSKIDDNSDGIISKGELIATLHKHRKDYYNDARINRRFSRADRNEDRKISFNEYIFLNSLKHPTQK